MPDTLVIFDCDGVLVDSEPISNILLRELLLEFGREVDDSFVYEAFLGRSQRAISEIIEAQFEIFIPERRWLQFSADILRRFEGELAPIPGISSVLDQIPHSVCVASSSAPDRVRRSLELTGIDRFFDDAIYSSSMVSRGKPHPDLFLYAAAKMNKSPVECIVIEDSATGTQAAKAAGMRTVAFLGGSHARGASLRDRLTRYNPDFMIARMADLPGALAQLGEGHGQEIGGS